MIIPLGLGIECNAQTVPATVRWTTNRCHLTGRRLKEEIESGYHHEELNGGQNEKVFNNHDSFIACWSYRL